MNNETKTDRTLTGDEARSVAADFENREFTPDELAKIKRARPSLTENRRGAW